MKGRTVVTTDDENLGHVIEERGDIAIVESGHLRKHRHAIPTEVLHDTGEGTLRATVAKPIVESAPGIDDDGNFDRDEILTHYGLIAPTVVDPDPDGLDHPESTRELEGMNPAPAERLGTLGGEGDPAVEEAAVFDKMPSGVQDPSGSNANFH